MTRAGRAELSATSLEHFTRSENLHAGLDEARVRTQSWSTEQTPRKERGFSYLRFPIICQRAKDTATIHSGGMYRRGSKRCATIDGGGAGWTTAEAAARAIERVTTGA